MFSLPLPSASRNPICLLTLFISSISRVKFSEDPPEVIIVPRVRRCAVLSCQRRIEHYEESEGCGVCNRIVHISCLYPSNLPGPIKCLDCHVDEMLEEVIAMFPTKKK